MRNCEWGVVVRCAEVSHPLPCCSFSGVDAMERHARKRVEENKCACVLAVLYGGAPRLSGGGFRLEKVGEWR